MTIEELQQENKQLKGQLEEKTYLYNKLSTETKYSIEELQQENKQLKEEYKSMRKIVDDGMINMTKDGIVHMNGKAYERFGSYRDIVYEARDFLNNDICYVGEKAIIKPYTDLNELIEIIKGDSNE